MKLTLGDMTKAITVEDAIEAAETASHSVYTLVQALLEHWTDDEGLHQTPFSKELAESLPEVLFNATSKSLSQKGLI